jgi:hypothetical protein
MSLAPWEQAKDGAINIGVIEPDGTRLLLSPFIVLPSVGLVKLSRVVVKILVIWVLTRVGEMDILPVKIPLVNEG